MKKIYYDQVKYLNNKKEHHRIGLPAIISDVWNTYEYICCNLTHRLNGAAIKDIDDLDFDMSDFYIYGTFVKINIGNLVI